MDIELIRTLIKELNNDNMPNKAYNFYYDETNNYRKVKLLDFGLGFKDNRILTDNYTLGGICIEQEKVLDTYKLMTSLKLQKNQELKAKTFFKKRNEFIQCIGHPKLELILDWILDYCYIHYSDMDALYYSVINIVDSVCDSTMPYDLVMAFKSELYILLRKNLIEFLYLCTSTDYPNITEVNLFCNGLIDIINNNEIEENDESDDYYNGIHFYTLGLFRQLLKNKRKGKELIFLKDNNDKTIIDSFYHLRQQQCIVFNTSHHIFDNEVNDEESMNENKVFLENGDELRNFEFKDSKLLKELQISDIIIYLMSKFLKFITYTELGEIESKINCIGKTGRENTRKLLNIIDKSDLESKYFICTIMPQQVILRRTTMYQYIKKLLNK